MSNAKTAKPEFILLPTYMAAIRGSVDAGIFRRAYFKIGGKKIDVLRDGDLSCAFFVSVILKLFGLISEIHTTVAGTEEDLSQNGWHVIRRPRPGSVIVYAAKKVFPSEETHKHIGFYLGHGIAISNKDVRRSPQPHPAKYRKIEKILWHEKLT